MNSPKDADELLRTFLATRDESCPECGYNLRGNTDAKCPECGTLIALRAGKDPRSGPRGLALAVLAIVGVKSLLAAVLLLLLSPAAAAMATMGAIGLGLVLTAVILRGTRWRLSDATVVWTALCFCGVDGIISAAVLLLLFR